jgi:hypothetical protein
LLAGLAARLEVNALVDHAASLPLVPRLVKVHYHAEHGAVAVALDHDDLLGCAR